MAEHRTKIRFQLGWVPVEIALDDGNRTVLQYLRGEARLPGTKEGCAEGDCGACTVVLGELQNGEVVYRAVNACILFLGELDGKQVLSIEHLGFDGVHEIQQAMVDLHGSQCGFCTPGIVMSLIAHHLNGGGRSRLEIDNALAGNLCRCTGYGPIIEAAKGAIGVEDSHAWLENLESSRLQLTAWSEDKRPLHTDGFFIPRTLEQFTGFLAENPQATIVAGATDVGLWVTKLGRVLAPMVSLGGIAALAEIHEDGEDLQIGAAVTYGQAERALTDLSESLGELVRRIGSTQVRNRGTVCGNIANGSPIGDMPPALIVLGATVLLRSQEGTRTVGLEDFFIDYGKQDLRAGEFIESVRIPRPVGVYRCYKISKRFDQDISSVMGAFNLQFSDAVVTSARVAFGGMAATPKRALQCEKALTGAPWNEQTIEAAQQALDGDFTPMSDARASAAYRTLVARNLLQRFYLETQAPDMALELAHRDRLEARLHG